MHPILVLLAAKLSVRYVRKPCMLWLRWNFANASLVYDDVVDESTERRGQLSVNAIFNNKLAVLAGDYLFATALVQVGMTRNHDIIDIVSAWGRIWQMVNFCSFPTSAISISRGSLFRRYPQEDGRALCSLYEGGRSLGGSQLMKRAESARLFGEYIGLCFQIKDDTGLLEEARK